MSYTTIHQCAHDASLRNRVTAACAQEGELSPEAVTANVMWPLSAASDVEAAYASALAANNPAPGADESVIPDAMILAKVQAILPTLPQP